MMCCGMECYNRKMGLISTGNEQVPGAFYYFKPRMPIDIVGIAGYY